VLGLSPSETPLQLYARLTTGLDPWARAKELGRALEPALVALAGGVPAPRTGPGAPDGWAERDGRRLLVVVKNAHWCKASEVEWPPPWLYAIVQHELAATGATGALAGVLFSGAAFKVGPIGVDSAYQDTLREAEAAFLGRLERGEPPPADGSPAELEAVKALYPEEDGRSIALGRNAAALWDRCVGLRARARDYRKAAEAAEVRLRAAIGQHSEARLPGGRRLRLRFVGSGRRLVEG
jgi:hypothetical protein